MLKRSSSSCTAAVFAAALVLSAESASAQGMNVNADLFTAYANPVDAEAETAAKAREIALIKGQRQGLTMVLRRLTLASDWARLPKITDSRIGSMVDGIQVEDEKTSPTRYLANLIVEFRKDDVRSLLRFANLPFTETRARTTLVLPILSAEGSPLLFADDNPWLAAWAAHEVSYGAMFPLVIPIGDLEDVAAVDAVQALQGNEEGLARIASRYGTSNVLVATATQVNRGGRVSIDMRLQWHGPLRSGSEVSGLRALQGESIDALMARFVTRTVNGLEEQWKSQTLLRFNLERRLSARVPISTLQDWVAVRKRLDQNGMIRSYAIASISRQAVQINLQYLGEPDQLAVSLAQDSLELIDEDGFWVLTFRQGFGPTARE